MFKEVNRDLYPMLSFKKNVELILFEFGVLRIDEIFNKHFQLYSPEGSSFEASSLRLEVAKSTSYVYAVESMVYMTAGLMDLYKNTNIEVESAILKVNFVFVFVILKHLNFVRYRKSTACMDN